MSVLNRLSWRSLFGVNAARTVLIGIWSLALVIIYIAAFRARFSVGNVDVVSYVSIAEQYANGFIGDALNAYWSPMLSWLLVPFTWAGVETLNGVAFINATAGLAGAAMGSWFIWHRTRRSFIATLIFMVVALSLAAGAVASTSPDVLVVLWSIVFVVFVVWADEQVDAISLKKRIFYGAIVGVIGALGYFTKLFLLPFFFASLIAWYIVRVILSRREIKEGGPKARLRHATLPIAALAAFVLVAAPWVISLSLKYDTFMIGSSFAVNVTEKFVPEAGVHAPEEETPSLVVESPPNEHAVAYIEDPTLGVAAQQEVAASNESTLEQRVKFYVKQRIMAFPYYLQKLGSVAPFAVPSMLTILVCIMLGFTRYRSHPASTLIAILWSVYFLGYAAIVSVQSGGGNHRYFWPLLIWSVMAFSLYWPSIIFRAKQLRFPVFRSILVSLLALVIPFAGVLQLATNTSFPFSTIPSKLSVLPYIQPLPPGKLFERRFAEVLQEDGVLNGGEKIASNDFRRVRMFAFYSHAHAYGRDRIYDINDEAFQDVLREKDIDLFFYFNRTPRTPFNDAEFGEVIKTYGLSNGCNSQRTPPEGQPILTNCSLEVIRINK